MRKANSRNRFSGILVLFLVSFHLFGSPSAALEEIRSSSLSCHALISVSLDENCSSVIDPLDILSASYPFQTFTVSLTDKFGNAILPAILTEDHLWTTITAKVTSQNTGNSCWSQVKVEDKLAPVIECSDYTINCFDSNVYEPAHYDACANSSLEKLSESVNSIPCNAMVAKTIETLFIAKDEYGNKSLPCTQTISIARVDLDLIQFPPSYELINNTELICSEVEFDANGFPSLETTKIPTYLGQEIYPTNDLCSVVVRYEDMLINTNGCTRKFMRTWRVYQEYCSNFNVKTHQQIIELADSQDPIIECPDALIVNTDGSLGCDATVTLELADYSDDCTQVIEMDIVTPAGFFNNVTEGPQVNLLAGVNVIQYTVYDACDNFATCNTTVTVLDNAPPTARCDQSSVVSLRSDGSAVAKAFSFDEGSFDDCSLYKNFIKRVDDPCGCVIPEYDDMKYLGAYQGHHYYISKIERYGFEAFNYSEAMGGHILKTETITEHSWVLSKVREYNDEPYLIGLKDKNNVDVYQWHDHTISNLDLWETNFPDSEDCVVVNYDGNWETVDGNENRYFFIMELEDICNFSDKVYFCCLDAGKEVPMVLRVVDRFGRYNDCEFTTEIQDKVAPNIVCPQDRLLDCSTFVDTTQLDQFGIAEATDQCFVNITSEFVYDRNDCGVGEIVRIFTASDANGSSVCEQVLSFEMLGAPAMQEIVWPMDYESDLGCLEGDIHPDELPDGFDYPDFDQVDCGILTSSYSDKVYSFAGSSAEACFKVIRTWTVEDECLSDELNYQPLVYEQVLKISNSVEPTIVGGCDDITVFTDDCDEALVEFPVLANDDCTSDNLLRGSLQLDIDSDGSGQYDLEVTNFKNAYQFSETLKTGNHFAVIAFRDQCGNVGTCTKLITVESNAGPSAKCVPGLVAVIQDMDMDGDGEVDNQMAMIMAENLNPGGGNSNNLNGSSHPCGFDISFSFSADIDDTVAIFNCDDYDQTNILELWVTDEFGNTDVCTTLVEVQDESNRCGRPDLNNISIGGEIASELGAKLEGVVVDLVGSNSDPVRTNGDGHYEFPLMPAGGYYNLRPSKNTDALEGVSTLDLLKIQRHILGLEALDSPYKLIAADIDKSGEITAKDLIELRKLILGVYDEFPNNESWRLIDAAYEFLDASTALSNNIPDYYEIFKLNSSMNVNFVGVKTGDVDDSASSQINGGIISRSKSNALSLNLKEAKLESGQNVELEFRIENISDIEGFQLQLNFDKSKCDVIGFKSDGLNLSSENINLDFLSNGVVRLSWNEAFAKNLASDGLFTIVVNAKENIYVSDLVSLNDEALSPEIYANQKAIPLKLNFSAESPSTESLYVYQNAPNPWSEMTTIKYYSDENQAIHFSVFDINGKLVYKQIREASRGINAIELMRYEIQSSGVHYYEFKTETQRIINKMILID